MYKSLSELANSLALEYGAWIVHPKAQPFADRKSLHAIIPAKNWIGAVVHVQLYTEKAETTAALSIQAKDKNYVLDVYVGELDDLIVNGLSNGDVLEFRFSEAAPVKMVVTR